MKVFPDRVVRVLVCLDVLAGVTSEMSRFWRCSHGEGIDALSCGRSATGTYMIAMVGGSCETEARAIAPTSTCNSDIAMPSAVLPEHLGTAKPASTSGSINPIIRPRTACTPKRDTRAASADEESGIAFAVDRNLTWEPRVAVLASFHSNWLFRGSTMATPPLSKGICQRKLSSMGSKSWHAISRAYSLLPGLSGWHASCRVSQAHNTLLH